MMNQMDKKECTRIGISRLQWYQWSQYLKDQDQCTQYHTTSVMKRWLEEKYCNTKTRFDFEVSQWYSQMQIFWAHYKCMWYLYAKPINDNNEYTRTYKGWTILFRNQTVCTQQLHHRYQTHQDILRPTPGPECRPQPHPTHWCDHHTASSHHSEHLAHGHLCMCVCGWGGVGWFNCVCEGKFSSFKQPNRSHSLKPLPQSVRIVSMYRGYHRQSTDFRNVQTHLNSLLFLACTPQTQPQE